MTGNIYVISGPSGSGKSTIASEIVKINKDFKQSISFTTRQPRSNEVDGVDYYFISDRKFNRKDISNEFIETTEIYGNKYGTSKTEINKIIDSGKNIIMVLDSAGAFNIKKEFPNSRLVYLLPPSLDTLKARLKGRDSGEHLEELDLRFKSSVEEIKQARNYDYCIVNDSIFDSVDEFMKIVKGEYMEEDINKKINDFLREPKDTVIVNMLAGPGAGKTQSAWSIAAGLKAKGVIVEYVPEYAKELVWDERFDLCDGSYKNELAIYKEQKHRIDRLIGKVDVIVTDRPLILSNIYIDKDKNTAEDFEKYVKMVNQDFSKYNNINYFICRSKEYVQAGRMQTEDEAKKLDADLLEFLNKNDVSFTMFNIGNIIDIVWDIHAEVVNRKSIIQNSNFPSIENFVEEQNISFGDVKQSDGMTIDCMSR